MKMKVKRVRAAALVLAFGLAMFPHTAFASGAEEETWEPWEFMNVYVEGFDQEETADEIETYDAQPEGDAQGEDTGSELLVGELEGGEDVGEEDVGEEDVDDENMDGVAIEDVDDEDMDGVAIEDVDDENMDGVAIDEDGAALPPTVYENAALASREIYAASRDDAIAGVYTAAKKTSLQASASEEGKSLLDMDENAEVHCYGYYTETDGTKWFYIQYFQDGETFTGFCSSEDLNI